MKTISTLGTLLESFFGRYLVSQRRATRATLLSYRDSLRLFLQYVASRTGKPPCELGVSELDRDVVLAFLDDLENTRRNTACTRNVRLTALRSFFRHVSDNDPTSLGVAQRVLGIQGKRTVRKAVNYLTRDELTALLEAPDRATPRGRRDHALILFLARTGARISEALGVNAADLHVSGPRQVLLRGKRGKERSVPLAVDLAETLTLLYHERQLAPGEKSPVFVNAKGNRLTRFGGTHILRRAVARSGLTRGGVCGRKISPHGLRHTLAMHLLQSGVDVITIQAWLGHAQVTTTHRYAEADVEMMRKSLEQSGVSPVRLSLFKPPDSVMSLLAEI